MEHFSGLYVTTDTNWIPSKPPLFLVVSSRASYVNICRYKIKKAAGCGCLRSYPSSAV